MTFVTDFVTFGGQGVNFGDLRNRFSDLWGVRGSTLVTFVTDFVTFGGSGAQFW